MEYAQVTRGSNLASLYTRLDLTVASSIRLLKILPNASDGSIDCELRVVDLSSNLEYVALSYTWGPATTIAPETSEDIVEMSQRRILCRASSTSTAANESSWHECFVTQNLYEFLLRVQRDETLFRDSYWIDTICINQNNDDERTRQVRMMGAIYQSAEVVYAWLGEEDSDTPRTFELMRSLAARCSGNERHSRIKGLRDITPEALSTGALTVRLGVSADAHTWKALATLFDRRYFTRVWTIQEITLAKKLIAFCGRTKIDWEDVVKVSEFLTVSTWTKWFAEMTGSRAHYHSVPNILDANKSSQDMLYSLIRFRRFSCMDPRDKVYALLGVAGSSVQGKRRYVPMYVNGRQPKHTLWLRLRS